MSALPQRRGAFRASEEAWSARSVRRPGANLGGPATHLVPPLSQAVHTGVGGVKKRTRERRRSARSRIRFYVVALPAREARRAPERKENEREANANRTRPRKEPRAIHARRKEHAEADARAGNVNGTAPPRCRPVRGVFLGCYRKRRFKALGGRLEGLDAQFHDWARLARSWAVLGANFGGPPSAWPARFS